jgi:4-amino-4-deoxy-L-arabinose transferase-like glycosyltransferase
VSARTPVLIALLVLAVIPYFVGLGDSAIWDANEAFYTETPREMLESRDYVSPSFNYQPRFNKPVLSYWIVAGFYRLLGVSTWSERLAIGLSAMILVGAVFIAARTLWSVEAGLWAAIALASSPRVLMWSRRIFIDVYITMFMGLTLLFFLLAERRPTHRGFYLFLMYVCAGLGMLTKGPVAVVLPALVFLIYLILQHRILDLGHLMIPVGLLLVAAIVAPWYIAVYMRHGWQHIVDFFWWENIGRYTDPLSPRRGYFFYLPVLVGDLFPWSLYLPLAAWLFFKSPRTERRSHESLLWLWAIVIVLFFSVSRTKQDLYIFPIVTAVAALSGIAVARGTEPAGQGGGGFMVTSVLASLLLIAGGAVALYLFAGPTYPLAGVYSVAFIAGLGGVAAAAAALSDRRFAVAGLLALTMIGVNWIFVLRTLPSFERYKPVPALTTTITRRAGPDAVVLHYKVALPSMAFYLRGPYEGFLEAGPFIERLASAREAYALLTAEDYDALKPSIPVETCVLDRRPFFVVKLRTILARSALPEVVLVTNRCR